MSESDLGENVIFKKQSGDVLEVNQKYIGIKSREDAFMSINFRVPPEDMEVIKGFFQSFDMIEPFKLDICSTGDIPVFFRGISPVLEKKELGNYYSFMALTVQESVKTPEEIDLCHECTGCGLHFENTPQ